MTTNTTTPTINTWSIIAKVMGKYQYDVMFDGSQHVAVVTDYEPMPDLSFANRDAMLNDYYGDHISEYDKMYDDVPMATTCFDCGNTTFNGLLCVECEGPKPVDSADILDVLDVSDSYDGKRENRGSMQRCHYYQGHRIARIARSAGVCNEMVNNPNTYAHLMFECAGKTEDIDTSYWSFVAGYNTVEVSR